MHLSKFWKRGLLSLALLLTALNLFDWARPVWVSAAMEYNEKVPLHDDFDGCSGERILINGVQHIVGRFTRDGAGRLHFGFTRNTQGTGIGQTSGDTYILTDAVTRTSFEVAQGEVTITERYQALLIRLGEKSPNDDSIVYFLSRVTIDANGDMTASIEIQNAECR